MQEAYEKYQDEVGIIALDPMDDNAAVEGFKSSMGLTFPMANCDPVFQDVFQINAYPTTLVIDRTGTICLSHVGMFTDSTALCNALEYFTQETYEQKVFETIEEIPEV